MITITKDNYKILKNLENIKTVHICYLPENYDLTLKGYKKLENIFLSGLKNQHIILKDLENLSQLKIFNNNKITLTLEKGLNKLKLISNNLENIIIDNFNYLSKLEKYEFFIKSNYSIILGKKFKYITKLTCVCCFINIILDEFPKLEELNLNNSILNGKSKFPLLQKIQIDNTYNRTFNPVVNLDNFFLLNSDIKFLKHLNLTHFFVTENNTTLSSDSNFENLETLILITTNIKRFDFNINKNNPILKRLELNPNIKISENLYNIIPGNVRNEYTFF